MILLPQPLIHVGYPKAASTWLQQTLFSDEKAGFYAPWGFPSGDAIEQFVLTNSFRFCAKSTRQFFAPGFQESARKNLIPVLSQESLIGNQVRGCYWTKDVADRIYETFPEAKILILIREQKAAIASSYRQYIRKGETGTLDHFLGTDKPRQPGIGPICMLDRLEYDLPIAYYQKLFGENNVLVLPMELLKTHPQSLIQKILEFVGSTGSGNYPTLAQNVGFKAGTLAIRRHLNVICGQGAEVYGSRLLWKTGEKLSEAIDRYFPQTWQDRAEQNLKQSISEIVGTTFQLSNQKTSQFIEIDLSEFSYDC